MTHLNSLTNAEVMNMTFWRDIF